MTREEHKRWIEGLAKVYCAIAGMDPIDRLDGSSNYWIFLKEAEEKYNDIVKRFPFIEPPKEE